MYKWVQGCRDASVYILIWVLDLFGGRHLLMRLGSHSWRRARRMQPMWSRHSWPWLLPSRTGSVLIDDDRDDDEDNDNDNDALFSL